MLSGPTLAAFLLLLGSFLAQGVRAVTSTLQYLLNRSRERRRARRTGSSSNTPTHRPVYWQGW